MRCVGTHQAMIIEARVEHPDGDHEHYAIARESAKDPQGWTTITYVNDISFSGATQTHELRLHPQELFTGQQAAEAFADTAYVRRTQTGDGQQMPIRSFESQFLFVHQYSSRVSSTSLVIVDTSLTHRGFTGEPHTLHDFIKFS